MKPDVTRNCWRVNKLSASHTHIVARWTKRTIRWTGPRFLFLFHCGGIDCAWCWIKQHSRGLAIVFRASLWCSIFFVFADWALSVRPTQRVRRIKFAPVVRFIQWPGELNLQPPFAVLRQPVWLRLFTRFKTARGQIELLINDGDHRCWVGVLFRIPPL